MDAEWIGVYLGLAALGVSLVMKTFDFGETGRKVLAAFGCILILFGFGMIIHDYFTASQGASVEAGSTTKAAPVITQDNPTNSPSIVGDHNTLNINPGGENKQAEPAAITKYVCVTRLSPSEGKHALLVEFGVKRGQTNGFFGKVDFEDPYNHMDAWLGAPLRTDRQQVLVPRMGPYPPSSDDPKHLSYWTKFSQPSLNPHMSYYFYFEAEKPLELKEIFFLEDLLALSDDLRANELAKQFETCPRGRG